jgi:outer membrane protein assembly factor BamD (BamD/ComL family)
MLKILTRIPIILFLCSVLVQKTSAQTLSFDLKKPKKFENRKLGSEKSAEKKFNLPRRFTQNTVTHYNWYFNANNKLNEVVANAKEAHLDDYSRLLSFYDIDLDYTSANASDLDSVISRSNAGILVHDLRNSWIDNLYMLMGRAYFYKKELDSAYMTFQFINYVYAPKEKDGYDKPIGSNSTEGGNAFTISTKEKSSLTNKAFTTPPSRNEALIWQIRTYIAKNELGEAAGLIETLKADPLFPERLELDLYEVEAWWFYRKELSDSAAVYLEKALNNADNVQEKARWEYLVAQLHERSNRPDLAEKFYERAIKHTLNPVLEVYARLNAIRQNKSDSNAIQKSIDELLKMGRKDRYTNYRDIIYYTAAQVELERNNLAGAKALLLKATEAAATNSNSSQRTKAFLLLGDLSYKQREYRDAKRFYDSIVTNDASIENPKAFESRKNLLAEIVLQSDVIYRQDSLQHLASLTDAEREVLIRKMAKKLRKEQGLKDDEPTAVSRPVKMDNRPASDLFEADTKGEWYFNNPSLKSKGYTEFRRKWGNRPNEDNWRRISVVMQRNAAAVVNDPAAISSRTAGPDPAAISYEALLKNVPLTPAQMNVSNDSIQVATMLLSTAFMEGLEDYPTVIQTLEPFLERFPSTTSRPKALFQLYYSYIKTGDKAKADNILRLLQEKYPGSNYERMASNSRNGISSDPVKASMTAHYDSIYNLFIEGRFDEALARKKVADSLYKKNYWTPQLLYIESIYHIRQRDDSTAKAVLQNIISLYPSTPMAAKAYTLIDVLNRRNEIENYLTNLQISRPIEDSTAVLDTAAQKQVVVNPTPSPAPVAVNQAPQPVIKPNETRKDTVQARPLPPPNMAYTFNADLPHSVVVVMDKVDPVYVSESRNAFNRYNKEKFYNRVIDINNQALNDTTRLVVMSSFENAATALDYLEKTRKAAAKEIVPWLPAGKYYFILISSPNLEILKTKNNLPEYKRFLQQSFPGKFE